MEILSIGLKDIDLERRVIHIPNAKAGPRDQPIGLDLAEYLGGLLASVAPGQVWLFPANSACGHTVNIEQSKLHRNCAKQKTPWQMIAQGVVFVFLFDGPCRIRTYNQGIMSPLL